MPSNHKTASFLYLRSPREFIRIAGSLPLLPQRLMVNGDTLKISATSRTVSKSGRSVNFNFFFKVSSAIFQFTIYYLRLFLYSLEPDLLPNLVRQYQRGATMSIFIFGKIIATIRT